MGLLIILLNADTGGLSITFWLGIVITVMLGLLGFLARDAYSRLIRRTEDNEKEITELRKEIAELRKNMNSEMRGFDKKVSDLNINVLEKLNDIKNKFGEIRS